MWLAVVRDAAIVLLALESLVVGVLLALTLSQIRKLMRMLREEIAPMLSSASETLDTVSGTTTLVSQAVVSPLIKVTSYSAGALQAVRSLLFIGRKLGARGPNDGLPGDHGSGLEGRSDKGGKGDG